MPRNKLDPFELRGRSATPPRVAPLRSIGIWLAVAAAIFIVLIVWAALN
jgi:hypothetical protein